MNSRSAKKIINKLWKAIGLGHASPFVRRVVAGLIGGTIVLVGVAMIVLPGPAIVVIPVGLAILATEFVWARRWLVKARMAFRKMKRKTQRSAV